MRKPQQTENNNPHEQLLSRIRWIAHSFDRPRMTHEDREKAWDYTLKVIKDVEEALAVTNQPPPLGAI